VFHRFHSRSYQIASVALAGALMLIGMFAWDQWAAYEQALASAQRETRNVKVLLVEHTAHVFHAAEETLRAVAQVRQDAMAEPARWTPIAVHERLRALQEASPLYLAVGWFDADGNRLATSQSSTPSGNIAGQENFRAQREGSAAGFHISATLRSAQYGRPVINTSIPLRDAEGGFAGLANVALDAIQLAEIYRKVDLGPQRSLALVRDDGTYLARTPHLDNMIGSSIAGGVMFREHLPRTDSGYFPSRGAMDGVARLVSYERVPRLPLVVTVSVSRDDALAEFRRRLIAGSLWLAAMIAVLAAATWLLILQTRRREGSEARLHAGEARFREFAAASADWFWETDESARFVWISEAIEAATGRPPAWFYGKTREEVGYDGVSAEQMNEHLQLRREHRPFRDFEFRYQGLNGPCLIRSSGGPVFDADGRFRGYRGTARDVTELRRAEQRLRDAVEAIPGGFMLFDADDRLIYFNNNEFSIPQASSNVARLGETFETILRRVVGAGLIDCGPVGPEAWIAEQLRRHRQKTDNSLVTARGRRIEVIKRPTQEGGVVVLRFDVTERERARATLEASEARFRQFAAASGDWLWETDEEHRFVWMSDSVEAAVGVPAAWHYGKKRTELRAPGIPDEVWEAHLRTQNERRPFRDFEYLRRGPDGDRWLRSNGIPFFDAGGRFRGYRGTGSDITNLRRAELRLRDALESIPGGFLLFDAGDRLVYVNQANASIVPEVAAFHRVGESFESIVRKCLAAGLIADAEEDPEAWIAERVRRHRAAPVSTLLRHGMRWVEVIEHPTHDGGIIMLRFDVTERQHAAQAERQARAEADAASNAKSDFLSRMSHELRTPLNAIVGFAQMLQLNREPNLTAAQKEFTDYILGGGRHLLALVNEVLDMAGVEAGRVKLSLEPVDVADIVTQAVQSMRPVAIKAGVALKETEGLAGAAVRADIQRLRQVLLNLLSNAIKYNRPDGSVTVTATRPESGRIRISVSDTGVGIAPEHASRLFEPFQRLGAETTAVEGTGIGLALSKRLIEAMGGSIGYTGEAGQGSTFWVELPADVHLSPPPPPAMADTTVTPDTARGYSLLYVEDNPANLRLMEYVIRALSGVSLFSAPSGPLGIELALAHRPDVIVLDLNLPGMSGYDVLQRLKAMPETRDTPVIALTAAAMPADVARGAAAGFFRYVTKPLDVTSFIGTLDSALAVVQQSRAAGPLRH